MTVNELIEQLQQLPDDERQREVRIEINQSGGGHAEIQGDITRNVDVGGNTIATVITTEWW